MRVVHQGPNDRLAIALEKAFAIAGSPPSSSGSGRSNAVVEALLAGSARPAPRPEPRQGNALAPAYPDQTIYPPQGNALAPAYPDQTIYPPQGNALALGGTPTLQGLFSARFSRPPAGEAAPNGTAAAATNPPARLDQPAAMQPPAASSDAFIEVELPSGEIVEFPAGTPDHVMRSVLQREYGHGLTGGASRASYSELMTAMRRADAAGDGDAARRLGQLAVQARDREEARDQSKSEPVSAQQITPDQERALALARARRRRAEAEEGALREAAPLADHQAPSAPPQIVGGVIMPPSVPASGQWDAQPAQMGAKDYIRHGSDVAADMLGAGAAGVSRGVTGLADLPGVVMGGAGNLAASGLERAGVVSPGVATGMRDSFGMMPMGSGDLFRDTAAAATGGASEFRGDTTAGRYAGTVGEFVPSAMVMPGGPLSNALRYGVVPGLASEAAGQMTEGTAAEPWARAGAGMLAAPAVNAAEYGLRRAISPNGGADAARLALAQVLDDAGVPISAGQRVGNEALRRKEGMTNAGQALNDTQREALTRAALKTTGTDASRATPEVLAETAKRIGSVFDDVSRGVDVTPEPATLNALAAANETYRQLAPKGTQAPIIGEVVRKMAGAFRNGQTIPARTVNSWRSNLSKLTISSDGATRSAAIEALGALDDALASTLTNMGRSDDVARLATAREQWRNFLAIQKAATGAGENAAAGILSPSSLRNAVVQQGRASYAQGTRGELGTLARAAEGVIKPLPTSGTAENLRALGIPSAMWSAGGATAGYQVAGPMGGMLGALAAGAVSPAVGAARMSRPVQNWLGNQAVGRGGPAMPRNALSPVVAALLGLDRG